VTEPRIAAAAALPPAELPVQLARGVRIRDQGRLLVGGTPVRLLRLSARGAAVVAHWRVGPGPIGADEGERRLARRLIDAGMLDAHPDPDPRPHDLAIVVPVRDRAAQLDRCLGALSDSVPGVAITVVDDGSDDARAIAAVVATYGASLVRHDTGRGPGAARNSGLASTSAAFVAFVDSDVVVGPGDTWLTILAAHFADPRIGAAAPRVLALDASPGRLAGYERRWSSLDMGPRGGLVGPGRRTPYVPSTTLVVRRSAVPANGFDPALRIGEDVDFVWRMVAGQWLVTYDPRATVRHDHRLASRAFVARRRDYARSIAPLAQRHPHAVPALHTDPASLATVALLAAGRPRMALTVFSVGVLRLRHRLRGHAERPGALALELSGSAVAGTTRGAGRAIRRTWSPLLLAVALKHPRAATLLAAAEALRLLDDRHPHGVADVAIGVADDLIAAAGTWEGCLHHRIALPLLPAVSRPGVTAATHSR
jgi:mycofactocin system glycosyltransferase